MTENRVAMRKILRELQGREKQMLRLLERFVECESPSHDKAAVDRMGSLAASEWQKRDAKVTLLGRAKRGDHVRAEIFFGEGRPAGQILVLGHLDTVYRMGTIGKMPFRVFGGRAWGPGTFDMKAGIVQALAAVDALQAARATPQKRMVFLWTSDEEMGSETSRVAIESEARRSDAVLVLEPSFGRDGRLKTARKGVSGAEIIVTGRASHAGIDPERGVNAVHELALQIERLIQLNNTKRGITVQATVIEGGTVTNVVPDHARAELDIRYARMADSRTLDRQLRGLKPILKGARVEVRCGSNRPPLERTAAVGRLFHRAQSLMRELGLPLDEAATGGASDGNFTAALGVPTLDGLGAVGAGAHSPSEHIWIRPLSERAALIAGLLATL